MTHNSFAKMKTIYLICSNVSVFMKKLRDKLNKAKATGLLIGSLKNKSNIDEDALWKQEGFLRNM